jgi:hypothetical protein
MNSQAGVGCYSWGPGTVTYVFMVDLDNTLNIYWKGESGYICLDFAKSQIALIISRHELELARQCHASHQRLGEQ